jgi:hypothetical protein
VFKLTTWELEKRSKIQVICEENRACVFGYTNYFSFWQLSDGSVIVKQTFDNFKITEVLYKFLTQLQMSMCCYNDKLFYYQFNYNKTDMSIRDSLIHFLNNTPNLKFYWVENNCIIHKYHNIITTYRDDRPLLNITLLDTAITDKEINSIELEIKDAECGVVVLYSDCIQHRYYSSNTDWRGLLVQNNTIMLYQFGVKRIPNDYSFIKNLLSINIDRYWVYAYMFIYVYSYRYIYTQINRHMYIDVCL